MKLSIDLVTGSLLEWLKTVLADLNPFLRDQTGCERKTSLIAMSFVTN